MACTTFHGRLHDTVSETSFGPQCVDDNEAEALHAHIYRTRAMDPRSCDPYLLETALVEVRSGCSDLMPTNQRVLCVCGSGRLFHSTVHYRGTVKTHCAECEGTEVPVDRRDEIGRI